MPAHSSLLTKFGGFLAIIAGVLIVASGFATRGVILSTLSFFNEKVLPNLPSGTQFAVRIAILVLTVIITLGGITVISGGISILYNHVRTGRLLIALGGGTGFFGLVVTLVYSIITAGPTSLITHIEYWIGILLAVMARWFAKGR